MSLVFQPFLRFWTTWAICYIGTYAPFQPFLRFWIAAYFGDVKMAELLIVSTLLEILAWIMWIPPIVLTSRSVSTLLEILGPEVKKSLAIAKIKQFQPFLRFWSLSCR